jgi:hypothetical protein
VKVQKTGRSFGRGPDVAGNFRSEVARGIYLGSGLQRVIPYILLVLFMVEVHLVGGITMVCMRKLPRVGLPENRWG